MSQSGSLTTEVVDTCIWGVRGMKISRGSGSTSFEQELSAPFPKSSSLPPYSLSEKWASPWYNIFVIMRYQEKRSKEKMRCV